MNFNKNHNYNFLISGQLAVLAGVIWLILIYFFHQERLYGDSAIYLFQLINDKCFTIAHGRPISVVMQVIPYIQMQLMVSVKFIIAAFSFNEWLYYFLCALFMIYIMKDGMSALGMFFALFLGCRWNFFNPVSELYLASPFVFILYSLLEKTKISYWLMVTGCIIVTIMVYSHPFYSILLPVVLLLSYFFNRPLGDRKIYFIYIYSFLIIVFHFLFGFDDYEQQSMLTTQKTVSEELNRIFNFGYAKYFSIMIPVYLGSIALFVWTVIVLWRRKLKQALFVFILFCIGVQAMILFKYGSYFPDRFEPFERYFFLIPIIISLVFFKHVFNPSKRLVTIAVISILGYHSYLIYSYGLKVKSRYRNLELAISYAQQFPEQKMAFRYSNYYIKDLGHYWTLVTESTLISSGSNSHSMRQIFLFDGLDEVNKAAIYVQDYYFYLPWWVMSTKNLNRDYFSMENGKVREANTDAVQRYYKKAYFDNLFIQTEGLKKFKAGSEAMIPVFITNNNDIPLRSGNNLERIALSYQWYRNGQFYERGHIKSPIMADVYTTLAQDILIKMPKEKGDYFLKAELVINDNIHIQLPSKGAWFTIY